MSKFYRCFTLSAIFCSLISMSFSSALVSAQETELNALKALQPDDLAKENTVTDAHAQTSAQKFSESDENTTSLSIKIEDLKQAALELNRDLLILEEDLLFPANTQIAVYVSMDLGHYFALDAVKLKVDDELVGSHLYTDKENSALNRGGIQRLYVGNLKTGKHEITAFFHGYGPKNEEYKRAATYTLTKDQSPTMLEIRVIDSMKSKQPEFDFKEWHL